MGLTCRSASLRARDTTWREVFYLTILERIGTDVRGGNSDFGAPVYCIGNGVVTFARDARMGWGNVVIVRHAFLEGGKLQMVDSMYAHLNQIMVKNGQQVKRGQQVGTIGTNRGMYTAHLHYEVRKNLFIGINRSKFAKDLTNYHRPS
ncbi:MAG: M23 family metallopeptidase, partial [Spartobacteria bacterium]